MQVGETISHNDQKRVVFLGKKHGSESLAETFISEIPNLMF
jgi:hypothetical protein